MTGMAYQDTDGWTRKRAIIVCQSSESTTCAPETANSLIRPVNLEWEILVAPAAGFVALHNEFGNISNQHIKSLCLVVLGMKERWVPPKASGRPKDFFLRLQTTVSTAPYDAVNIVKHARAWANVMLLSLPAGNSCTVQRPTSARHPSFVMDGLVDFEP